MVEWTISKGLTPYPEALIHMERRVEAILAGKADEQVWLLEHPPMFTAGTSARREDLVAPDMFEVFESRRGGEYTYHGPGQRVAYVMLDLNKRGRDVRAYVSKLEAWVIGTLAQFNLQAGRREGRVGIWVPRGDGRDDKIAAIGIRVRQGVSFHGIAVNVDPDLSHYAPIVPCGIREHGVTSLAALGVGADMHALDRALVEAFGHVLAASGGRAERSGTAGELTGET